MTHPSYRVSLFTASQCADDAACFDGGQADLGEQDSGQEDGGLSTNLVFPELGFDDGVQCNHHGVAIASNPLSGLGLTTLLAFCLFRGTGR